MSVNIDDITKALNDRQRYYAKNMFFDMIQRCETDEEYTGKLAEWLTNGGTVLLRDELTAPFKDAWYVKVNEEGFYDHWHECWTALDTARLNAGIATGEIRDRS